MCCEGYGKHLDHTMPCSQGHTPAACRSRGLVCTGCCQLRASAQILGSLQLAEAHGHPAKSPLQPLVAAHLINNLWCRGERENPPAWMALHLIKHLCSITKTLLHSSDTLLLLILINYLTALKWERCRKTCNAFSDCLLSLTCN